jgi:hypothetical protein
MARYRRLSLIFLWGLLLGACAHGGKADFDLRSVPGNPVFESEEDYAFAIVDGRYKVLSNPWNKGATSGRYRQKIFVKEDRGQPVFGWVWKWRNSTGVATYPEVLVGHSPWQGEVAPNSGFPFQIGTKQLVVDYDLTTSASGAYNLAFEFWTVSALPVSKDRVTSEVMIWVAGEQLGAAGNVVGKVTLSGNTFTIFQNKSHGDASGSHSNKWSIVSLLLEGTLFKARLDVGEIIDYLVKNGFLNPSDYVADFELGNEVMRGAGMTVVRKFDVQVK